MDLLSNPRLIKEDYRYPNDRTSQTFVWMKDQDEWTIRFPSHRYGYVGIRFRHPYDVSPEQGPYRLLIRMRPAKAAKHLWVGLVSGRAKTGRVLVERPLVQPDTKADGKGWINLSIPVASFGNKGYRLMEKSEVENHSHDGSTPFDQPMDMDWSDMREILLIHHGGKAPAAEIRINKLQFRR